MVVAGVDTIWRLRFHILQQPPYSPGLASPDYNLSVPPAGNKGHIFGDSVGN